MLKHGFTLAEVLITLLIVGVVATLTTPALVKNVGSSKIGPQLSKFVNTMETGFENMMMDEAISNLHDQRASFGTNGFNRLSKVVIMTNLKNNTNPDSITIKKGDGSDYYTEKFSRGYTWMLKDGTIVIVDPLKSPAASAYTRGSGAYKYESANTAIFVDIGGLKGSHRAGKEVFCFMIDSSGILVPYGSNAHKSMNKDMTANCSNSSNNIESNFACTGAVVDNGYKAPW